MKPATQTANSLQALATQGQSVWLDYIQRSLITRGELRRLIEQEGLRGVTSNPAIFQKAIAGSSDYDDLLSTPAAAQAEPKAIYEQIAIRDIQDAADVLQGVYEETDQRDGYVSLEVSPTLAHDTAGTLAEARRLWQAVDRPNLMVKVPATPAGIPAIEQLIADGINVNVTLIFAVDVYRQVADAYLKGLEVRVADRRPVASVASVASFFVSRIDSAVDPLLEKAMAASPTAAATLQSIRGKTAIANAKVAYQEYEQIVSSPRWLKLADAGARSQRLLWASTGTKNPDYSDVLYVEELIGRDTVNTIPPATWQAFLEHGTAESTLTSDVEAAHQVLTALRELNISLSDVTDQLLADGVKIFADAFDGLLAAVAKSITRT